MVIFRVPEPSKTQNQDRTSPQESALSLRSIWPYQNDHLISQAYFRGSPYNFTTFHTESWSFVPSLFVLYTPSA